MEDKSDTVSRSAANIKEAVAMRTHLVRISLDTSALLNMVKHCREDIRNKAQGLLMGVQNEDQTLMITQVMPDIAD